MLFLKSTHPHDYVVYSRISGTLFPVSMIDGAVFNCIITEPDCGLANGTKLSNFMNYC